MKPALRESVRPGPLPVSRPSPTISTTGCESSVSSLRESPPDCGGGGGTNGWDYAAETFNVTVEQVRRGYTEVGIGKQRSGNVLRMLAEAGQVASGRQ